MAPWMVVAASGITTSILLTGCQSATTPEAGPPDDATSPTTSQTPQPTQSVNQGEPPPSYTVFSSCTMRQRVRRPDFQALACGDAGLQLVNIRYDKYTDAEATGSAKVYTRPSTGTDPKDVDLRELHYPVTFRAFRVREWKGWHYFTRLRLEYLRDRPPRTGALFSMPVLGPLAATHPPARIGPFLAANGHLCRASKLKTTASRGGGAGGWNIGQFQIRNTRKHFCALRGPVVFQGLDAAGATVTSVSICDRKDYRQSHCAAPVVLGQSDGDKLQRFPRQVNIQMYGYYRGGKRETPCPVDRQVRPATFQVAVGALTLRATNPPGQKGMWGCDDVTIAGRG